MLTNDLLFIDKTFMANVAATHIEQMVLHRWRSRLQGPSYNQHKPKEAHIVLQH